MATLNYRKEDRIYYKKRCDPCSKKRWESPKKRKERLYKIELKRRPWIKYKADFCIICGFIPINPCQLDVDHINGDKKNNKLSNLQTLCANCHRLKTYNNKDWESK